jgi:hypothetical protein
MGKSAPSGSVSVIVLPKMSADIGERWVGTTYSAGETQMPRYSRRHILAALGAIAGPPRLTAPEA